MADVFLDEMDSVANGGGRDVFLDEGPGGKDKGARDVFLDESANSSSAMSKLSGVKEGDFIAVQGRDGKVSLKKMNAPTSEGASVLEDVDDVPDMNKTYPTFTADEWDAVRESGSVKMNVSPSRYRQLQHIAETGAEIFEGDDGKAASAIVDVLPFGGRSLADKERGKIARMERYIKGKPDLSPANKTEMERALPAQIMLGTAGGLQQIHFQSDDEQWADEAHQLGVKGYLGRNVGESVDAYHNRLQGLVREQMENTVARQDWAKKELSYIDKDWKDIVFGEGRASVGYAGEFAVTAPFGGLVGGAAKNAGRLARFGKGLLRVGVEAQPVAITHAISDYEKYRENDYTMRNGDLEIETNGDDPERALFKAIANNEVEAVTEIGLGELTAPILRGLGKVFNKSKATSWITGVGKGYAKIREATKFGDILFEELPEENVQYFFSDVLGLGKKDDEWKGIMDELAESRKDGGMYTLKGQWNTVLAMLLQMGGQAAIAAPGAGLQHIKNNRRLANVLEGAGMTKEQVAKLSYGQREAFRRFYNKFADNPDRLKEALTRFDKHLGGVADQLVVQTTMALGKDIAAYGETPHRFEVQVGQDGKPVFRQTLHVDVMTDKIAVRNSMTDDVAGVTIVDNGVDEKGNGDYEVYDEVHPDRSFATSSFDEAVHIANVFSLQNQRLKLDNQVKERYFNTLTMGENAKFRRGAEAVHTVGDLLRIAAHDIRNHGSYHGATSLDGLFVTDGNGELMYPPRLRVGNNAKSIDMSDGTMVVILDNILDARQMNEALAHKTSAAGGKTDVKRKVGEAQRESTPDADENAVETKAPAFAGGVDFKTEIVPDADGNAVETKVARDEAHGVTITDNGDGTFTVWNQKGEYAEASSVEEAVAIANGAKPRPKEKVSKTTETPAEQENPATTEERTTTDETGNVRDEAQPQPEQRAVQGQEPATPVREAQGRVEAESQGGEVRGAVEGGESRAGEVVEAQQARPAAEAGEATPKAKKPAEAASGASDAKPVETTLDDLNELAETTRDEAVSASAEAQLKKQLEAASDALLKEASKKGNPRLQMAAMVEIERRKNAAPGRKNAAPGSSAVTPKPSAKETAKPDTADLEKMIAAADHDLESARSMDDEDAFRKELDGKNFLPEERNKFLDRFYETHPAAASRARVAAKKTLRNKLADKAAKDFAQHILGKYAPDGQTVKAKRAASRAATKERAKAVAEPDFLGKKAGTAQRLIDYLADKSHNRASLHKAIQSVRAHVKKFVLLFPKADRAKVAAAIDAAQKRLGKMTEEYRKGFGEQGADIPRDKLAKYLERDNKESSLLGFWLESGHLLVRPRSAKAAKDAVGVKNALVNQKFDGKLFDPDAEGADALNGFFDGMKGAERTKWLRILFGRDTGEVTTRSDGSGNDEIIAKINNWGRGDYGNADDGAEGRYSLGDIGRILDDFAAEVEEFEEFLRTNETAEERAQREQAEYEHQEEQKVLDAEFGPIDDYLIAELETRGMADLQYANAKAFVENRADAHDVAILTPSALAKAEEGDKIRLDHHKQTFDFLYYDAENGTLYVEDRVEVETDEGEYLAPRTVRFRVTEDGISEIKEESNDTGTETGTPGNRALDEKGAATGGSREEGQGGKGERVQAVAASEESVSENRGDAAGTVSPEVEQYRTVAKAVDRAWQVSHPDEVAKLLEKGINVSAVAENPALGDTDKISWPITATRINSRNDAANLFRLLSNPDKEITKALYLNAAGNILESRVISAGLIGEVDFNYGDVVANMPEGTFGVVFSHNHPAQQGAEITPTPEDFAATNNLRKALESNGVLLLDHIITDHNAYHSFVGTGVVSDFASDFWNEMEGFGDTVAKPADTMNLVPYDERIDLTGDVIGKLNTLAALASKAHDKSSWIVGIDDEGRVAFIASFPKGGDAKAFLAQHHGGRRFAVLNDENAVDMPSFVKALGKGQAVIAVGENGRLVDFEDTTEMNPVGLNDKILAAAKPAAPAASSRPAAPRLANAPKLNDAAQKQGLDLLDELDGLLRTRLVGADVKNTGRDIDVNSIATVFGAEGTNIKDENLVYPKTQEEKRSVPTRLNPGRHTASQPDGSSIAQSGAKGNADLRAPVDSLDADETRKLRDVAERLMKHLAAQGYGTFDDMMRFVAANRPDAYARLKDPLRRAWNWNVADPADEITFARANDIFGRIDAELQETQNGTAENQLPQQGGARADGARGDRGRTPSVDTGTDDRTVGTRTGGVEGGRRPRPAAGDGRRGDGGNDQFGERGSGRGGRGGNGGDALGSRAPVESDAGTSGEAQRDPEGGVHELNEVTPGFTAYEPPADLPVNAPKSQSLIVEPSALASIPAPPIKSKPDIPDSIPANGVLQAHQYQAVCQAVDAHNGTLPDGRRKGYFVGDGTGAGKTRIIAGVMLDALNRKLGKGKALIISKNSDLYNSALDDFKPFGIYEQLFPLDNKWKKRLAQNGRGIAFTTYSSLAENYAGTDSEGKIHSAGKKGKTANRFEELVKWLGKDFDGVIAFDEAHTAAKESDVQGRRQAMLSQAAVDLQNALPNARVLYLTATAAYDAEDLRFLTRMGLWGEDAGFETFNKFAEAVNNGGLSMMEILTQGMKANGQYCSRSISFKGVNCKREVAHVTPEQKQTYGDYASTLSQIHDAAMRAADITGARPAQVLRQYFARSLDLFNSLITAMKIEKAVELGKKAIAEGKSPVFQLISTNEAAKKAKLDSLPKKQTLDLFGDVVGEESADAVEVGVKDRVLAYLNGNGFPVREYLGRDEHGNEKWGDSLPGAVAVRNEMIALVNSLPDVANPIDALTKAFADVGISRITGGSNKNAETAAFNDGMNLALVFSGAGGTGASYHADKRFKNQRQRVQIPIEFGWEPDKFLQALGRSHRNNQVVPPEFVLLTTDIAGEMRFMSTIANRVAAMGAIVGGDRNSSGQVVSSSDSADNKYGRAAIRDVIRRLGAGQRIGDMSAPEVLEAMFLNPDKLDKVEPNQFLGRLQFLPVDVQSAIYGEIAAHAERAIAKAKADGTYDDGIRKIEAKRVVVQSREKMSPGANEGQNRDLLTVSEWYDSRRINHEELENRAQEGQRVEYVRNKRSGKLYALLNRANGEFTRLAPNGGYDTIMPPERGNYETMDREVGRKAWDEEYSKLPADEEKVRHYMSGDLIPVWDKIGVEGRPFVYRATPAGARPFIGLLISDEQLPVTLFGFGKKDEARKFFRENAYRLVMREGAKFGIGAKNDIGGQPYFKRSKIGTSPVLVVFQASGNAALEGDLAASGWESAWAKDDSNYEDRGGTVYYREFGEDAEVAFNSIIGQYGSAEYRGDKVVFESKDGIAPAKASAEAPRPERSEPAQRGRTNLSAPNPGARTLAQRVGMPQMRLRVQNGELIITNTDSRRKDDLKLAFGGQWANRVRDGRRYVKGDLRWNKDPVGRGGWWSIPLDKVPAEIRSELDGDGVLHSPVAPLESVADMERSGGVGRLAQNHDEFKTTFVYNLLRSPVAALEGNKLAPLSEGELIRRAADEGDMTALGELYTRYMKPNAAKGGLKGLITRAAVRKGMSGVINDAKADEIASLVWAGTPVDGNYENNRRGIIADFNNGDFGIYMSARSLIPAMTVKIDRILNDMAERAANRPEMLTLDKPSASREGESELDQQIADNPDMTEEVAVEYVEPDESAEDVIARKLGDAEGTGRRLTPEEINRNNAMDMLDETMFFLPEELQDVINAVLTEERKRGYTDKGAERVTKASLSAAQKLSGLSPRVFGYRYRTAKDLLNEIWSNIRNGRADENIAIRAGEIEGLDETDAELNDEIIQRIEEREPTSDMGLAIRLLLDGHAVADIADFFSVDPALIRAWKARARNEHGVTFPGDEAENTLGLGDFPERRPVKRGKRSVRAVGSARPAAFTPDLFAAASATVSDVQADKIADGIAAGAPDEQIARDAGVHPELVRLARIREATPRQSTLFSPVVPLEADADGNNIEKQFNDPDAYIETYRSALLGDDGKLYPPMATKGGEGQELGKIYKSDEHPEQIIKNGRNAGKFNLKSDMRDSGTKGQVYAVYAPYFHSQPGVLNDQFSAAWDKGRMVTVKSRILKSDLARAYQAEGSPRKTGLTRWETSGPVARQMDGKGGRDVYLSQYIMPVEIVPDKTVAKMIKDQIGDEDVTVPWNVVPPSLRRELVAAGVKVGTEEEFRNGKGFVPYRHEDGVNSVAKHLEQSIGKFATAKALKDDAGSPLSAKIDSNSAVRHIVFFKESKEADRDAHYFAAKNILRLFEKADMGYSHDERKDNVSPENKNYSDRWYRVFAPYFYGGEPYVAMMTVRNYANKGYKAFYGIEALETYKGVLPPSYEATGISTWGQAIPGKTAPLTADIIAESVRSVKSPGSDTHPRMLDNSRFDPDGLARRINEQANAEFGNVGILRSPVTSLERGTLGIDYGAAEPPLGYTNAAMNEWRAEHGFDEIAKKAKVSLDDLHRQGAAMANNTAEMERMVERLSRAPYAVDPVSQVALGQYIVKLQNAYNGKAREKREAAANGNDALAVQFDIESDEILSRLDAAQRINNRVVGNQLGLAMRARQLVVNKDLTLADYMVSCVRAKGGNLTKGERADAERIYEAFRKANVELDEATMQDIIAHLDAISRARLAAQHDEVKERKARRDIEKIERDYFEALAQIRYHGEKRSGGVLHGLPNGQKWIRAIETYHLLNGEGLADGKPDAAKMVELVLKDILGQGVEATAWDVRQMESRMGNLIRPPQDEVSRSLRDLHSQMLVMQQMEHMIKTGEMPPKTGFDRDKESDAVRALRRERDRMMRNLGIGRKTSDELIASALDAYKTRLRNQIEDNEKAVADIESGKPYEKKDRRRLDLDEEARSLKNRNDELKKRIADLTNDRAKEQEKRVMRAMDAIARTIAIRKEQIAAIQAGTFDFDAKRPKVEDARLDEMRDELKALNEQKAALKKSLFPYGTDAEIERRMVQRMAAAQKSLDRWNAMAANYEAATSWEDRAKAVAPSAKVKFPENDALREKRRIRDAARAKVESYRKRLEREDTRGESARQWIRLLTSAPVLLRTMMDMSVGLVQGGRFMRAHPIKWAKAAYKATGAFLTQKWADRLADEIRNDSYFEDFKSHGGHLYSMEGLDADIPEDFRALETGAPLPGGKTFSIAKIPGIKRSARSFSGFLNKAGLELYRSMVESCGENGAGATDNVKKDIARFVNISLGYGYDKGRDEKGLMKAIMGIMDAMAWAPRKAIAELKYATGYDMLVEPWLGTRRHEKSGAEIRRSMKSIGREKMRYLLGSLAFGICGLLLGRLLNGDDDDGQNRLTDIIDPRSADLGRFRIGNTSFSMFAGSEMVWRLLGRLVSGQTKVNGKVIEKNRAEIVGQYLRGKANPLLGLAWDLATGRDYLGNEMNDKTIGKLARDYVIPLTWSAEYENFVMNDPMTAIVNALPVFYGGASSTYERDPLKRVIAQGDEAKRLAKAADESGDKATAQRIGRRLNERNAVYGAAKGVEKLERKIKQARDKGATDEQLADAEKILAEAREKALKLYRTNRQFKWDDMSWIK